MSNPDITRVALHQPALPRFRCPVFLSLSQQDDLEVKIVYESEPGTRNVDPGDLDARIVDPLRWETPLGPLMWAGVQWDLASRTACDVLIMTWNTRYLSLVPALLRARRQGVATILWGHGYSKRDSRARLWLRRAVTGLATAVVFYDHGSAGRFIESGADPKATFVARNAIDQTPIQSARQAWADSDRLDQFKRVHNFDRGPTIAFISRLDPSRRLDLLVEAVGILRPRHPDIQLVIIGQGDSEQQRLESQAEALGVSDALHFAGAMFEEHELAPWILSADVVALPSAVGLSVLTAFGFGRAVVANDNASSNGPEWTAIRHGENGMLFAAGNAASLAHTLDQVLGDEVLRRKLNAAALRTAEEEYTLDAMVQGMTQAISYCRSDG
jgi:glycosyltransferase involved in cell wall biosynthesis